MIQAVDRDGAADYLGISVSALTRRINNKRFPGPDFHESLNSRETDWWSLQTLEKYQRAQARNRNSKNR